jgi:predicted transposase YbfD/YdcC
MKRPNSTPAQALTDDNLAAIERLRSRFARLPDQRMAGRVEHRLDEVLLIAFCSILSDNDAYTDMEAFARSQMVWLRTFLPLINGAPSHDVFRNVFMALQPQALLNILSEWCGELAGEHVVIDGKALRGTAATATGKSMVHVLRAWVHAAGISAGHVVCSEKSNELEALPRLLEALMLKGATVTIDAMGCHPDIAEQIHLAGGDYVLALKGNQKGAHEAVSEHFAGIDALAEAEAGSVPATHQSATTMELSHGRFEWRVCTVTEDLAWFHKSWKWLGLRSVLRVRRTTHRGSVREALSEETHYYLSSLPAHATRLAAFVRHHWSVENSCHYVLDVTFSEDHCQVRDRCAAHNLCILRELTGRVLRHHPAQKSLRAKRKLAALDGDFRLSLLAHIPQNSHA